MSRQQKQLYEFGRFRLDTSERVLMRDGQLIPLTPKAYETLLVLVRNSGHIMEKEELLREIWQGTFVEEATLAQNIFTLRRALAAGSDDRQKYIETIPRRGYRFVAEVRELSPDAVASPSTQATAVEKSFVETFESKDESVALAAASERERPEGLTLVAEDDAEGDTAGQTPPSALPASDNGQTHLPQTTTQAGARTATEGDGAHALPAAETARPALAGGQRAATVEPGQGGRPLVAAMLIAGAMLLLVGGLSFGVYKWSVQKETTRRVAALPSTSFQSMKVTRVATNGQPQETTISPDGKYLAYISEEAGELSIWLKQTTANSAAQRIVAATPGVYKAGIVFSRDSQYLFYVGIESERTSQIFRIPVLGGAATSIITRLNSSITFAPDGQHFAFVRGDFEARTSALVVARSDGTDERTLATRRAPEFLNMPAWSPDGRLIACTLSGFEAGVASMRIVGFTVTDGAEKSLTGKRFYDLGQLAWLGDASGVVVSAAEEELSPLQMWLVSYPEGASRRITNDLNTYYGASLADDSGTLATLQTDRITNLWLMPAGAGAQARQLTYGTGKHDGLYGVSFMPDGRIVYASMAGGAWDIWTMNGDGTNQKQLTVEARSNYGPSPSPDGRYIVFVSNRTGGAFHVWRMNSDGTNPVQLTSGEGENFAHVTADGRSVIYATVSFNQPNQVWKVSIDGGEPVRLVERVASWPALSPDGKLLACTLQPQPGSRGESLGIFSIEGGEPLKVFQLPQTFRYNTLWTPDSRAVTYLDTAGGVSNIWSQPIAGGAPKQLTHFKSDGVASYGWSSDGRQLVCTRSVETTSIVLIKDFR